MLYFSRMLSRYSRKGIAWVDMVAPTPAEVRSLMHEFGIDPLIAEELLLPSFRPKVEKRGEVIYVILHFPTLYGIGRRPQQEIDFIVGKHFLITTHYESIDPLHSFAKAFEVENVLGKDGLATHGGHLFTSLVGSLYQALGNETVAMHQRLQSIEERIFSGKERQMVIELSQAGRVIHDFRQAFVTHKEMLVSLEPVMARMFGAEFAYHLRAIVGSYERVNAALDNLHDSLVELRETNNSLLSTKQNEVMKTFTVLAFIFLPMTYLVSIFQLYAMINPTKGTLFDFWIVIGFMVLLGAGTYIFFKKKGWL